MNLFRSAFQKYFIAGLLVILPAAASVWIIRLIIDIAAVWLPAEWSHLYHPFVMKLAALLVTILFILCVGFIARNFLGKALIQWMERAFSQVPLVNRVYTLVKQVLETLVKSTGGEFRSVVLIPFPKEGSFSIGFVTNSVAPPFRGNQPTLSEDSVYVFVPTVPNPTSGFLMLVPRKQLTVLPLSVEDAFKLIISGGIIQKFP